MTAGPGARPSARGGITTAIPCGRSFLPWCALEHLSEPGQLDRRTLNRFSSENLEPGGRRDSAGKLPGFP
jgi:hypothetical protein